MGVFGVYYNLGVGEPSPSHIRGIRMTISLLVGNGINRVSNHAASWNHVLNALRGDGPSRRELEHLKHKPFALVYEEILLTDPSANIQSDETEMKKRIAGLVGELQFNDLHRRIIGAGVKHVLTTNYDYGFEKASGHRAKRKSLARETKYSAFRRQVVGNTSVWHIHGEAGIPATITLGYDQYSGYLQKLREHATADRTSVGGSPFKRGDTTFDISPNTVYSWFDVFLRDDIHIIGLGLDYTEIDLWWALTYKARLKARGWAVGTTHFHDWHLDEADDQALARRSLLKALSVQVHPVRCERSCEPAYEQFIRTYVEGKVGVADA